MNDVIVVKNTFPGLICIDLSLYVVKIDLPEIFQNFQNGRHFEVSRRFLTLSCTEVESILS